MSLFCPIPSNENNVPIPITLGEAGLLDGIIPQYAYPDMVTQAVHVGDCELLEF